MAWASEKAYNYGCLALYRDKSPETAKWCGVPAPPSPFSHRRTRNYHQSASHGVALLSDHARYALDRRNRLYVMVRSCLVGPGNGPETPSLHEAKRRNRGGVRIEPGWSPPHWSLSDSDRTPNTKPTSAPTSTRDEPHVGTHICARPLRIHYSEFLERSPKLNTQSFSSST